MATANSAGVLVGSGATTFSITHGLGSSATVLKSVIANWPTGAWISSKSTTQIHVGFNVLAPSSGGAIDYATEV